MKVKLVDKRLPEFESREVELPDGTFVTVQRGHSAEVPDDLALSLLEQTDVWAPGDKAARAATEGGD